MSENQKVIIDINLTKEDFRRSLFWYHKAQFYLITILSILGIVGTGFISYIKEDVIALTLFWLALVYYIFYVITTYLSIKRQSQKLEALSEMTVIIFDKNGVELTSESTVLGTKWERYTKICETPTDFIFFPQENLFYPIPKHFFQNNLQIEEFKDLLRNQLGEKVKLLN